MEFLDSLLYLTILLVLLWSVKADLFFVVFGFAVLIFFLFQLFFIDPLEIIFSIVSFILLNPAGFLLFFIPSIISILKYIIKKIHQKRERF
jgi:hypothetical protein